MVDDPDADPDGLWRPESGALPPPRIAPSAPPDPTSAVPTPTPDSSPISAADPTSDSIADPRSDPTGDEIADDSPWSLGSGARFESPRPAAPEGIPVAGTPARVDASSAVRSRTGVAAHPAGATTAQHLLPSRTPLHRRRPLVVLTVIAILAIVIVAIVVVRVATSPAAPTGTVRIAPDASGVRATAVEPLVTELFAGADPRRLPTEVVERWTSTIGGVEVSGRTRVVVGPDDAVYGVFAATTDDAAAVADGTAATVVVALDPESGVERWRVPLDVAARLATILGVFDSTVVVRASDPNGGLAGLDASTGEVRWSSAIEDTSTDVALDGTELLARVSFGDDDEIVIVDPRTGVEFGRVPGELFATDSLGTWYVLDGDRVSRLDLRDGWSPPVVVATLAADGTSRSSSAATIVDGRLVQADGRALSVGPSLEGPSSDPVVTSGSILESAPSSTDPSFPAPTSADLIPLNDGGAEPPSTIQLLAPMVGPSFVLVGDGRVFGARLGDAGVDLRWKADGAIVDSVPTDRGRSLLLASDGGATQWVVDASTGRTIIGIGMVTGAIDTLQLVGNGVIVKRSAAFGFERAGIDLDGDVMWSLVGEGPLAVGNGVVAEVRRDEAGAVVTAWGDGTFEGT